MNSIDWRGMCKLEPLTSLGGNHHRDVVKCRDAAYLMPPVKIQETLAYRCFVFRIVLDGMIYPENILERKVGCYHGSTESLTFGKVHDIRKAKQHHSLFGLAKP